MDEMRDIINQLVDYVGAGVGDMDRHKAEQAIQALVDKEVAGAKLEGWIGGVESILKPLQKHGYLTTDGQSAYATPQDVQDIIDRLNQLKENQ